MLTKRNIIVLDQAFLFQSLFYLTYSCLHKINIHLSSLQETCRKISVENSSNYE